MALRPADLIAAALAATFACDGGLEPEPICARGLVGVCGTARFSGLPPATTEAVYVVAFPTYPQSCTDLLAFPPKFRPFSPSALPLPYVDSIAYDVPLSPDRYEWVVAVWKKPGTPSFTINDTALFRVAGEYRNPANPAQRGEVTVPDGGAASDIDVVVDFDMLRSVPELFPCPAP